MNTLIKREIEEIRKTIPQTTSLSDDLIFGIISYKYFYNKGRYDKAEFKSSFVDGSNDGGIDLIAVEENDLEKNLVLIQSKNISTIQSKDQIKDTFTKMAQTVKDFKDEKISNYNSKLRRVYREKYDDSCDDPNFKIKLTLFIGTELTNSYREVIEDLINRVAELESFECNIYDLKQLVSQIEMYDENTKYVSNGKIEIFKEHGAIEFGENGLIVNISALSLRKLFDRYKEHGLFEQNFRYFIKNKKIDEEINNSLKNKRDQFWFLNNGIIIGCKEFREDGDNIKLTDFSIVNGCQTTTLIGAYKGPEEDLDFPIVCKIVKPDKDGEDYFNLFISQIAESSNSQKPISDRDLKSNLPEQRKLQSLLKLENPKIYMEIKRGEKSPKNNEGWQKIKNDELGQLILAGLLQEPGTARSAKKKIFSDSFTYNSIFKRTQDKGTIIDLLKINNMLDNFIIKDQLGDSQLNIARNGRLTILAIICFLIKYKRSLINLKLSTDSQDWVQDITKDNLNGSLFIKNLPDEFEIILESIFNDIIQELTILYDSRGSTETSVTNFFKTDKKYHSIILERIRSKFILDTWGQKQFFAKIDAIIQ